MRNDLAARARELALLFTSWPSVTGSAGDAAFAGRAEDRLQHFDKAWTEAIPGDHAARSNFFALKRGRLRRTIILTGHFDVVSVEDYGALAEHAFAPDQLLPKLIARLRASGEHPKALADLESGDFIPGRGLLDMKAGLAAGLAAMEAYAGEATLLFVGVSDEEEKSAGARAAVPQVKAIAQELGLEVALVINLDAISDQGDGAKGRVVTYGSIGKQLLAAYVVGKQAHAGYPQDGVNAAYVMAEIVNALELAPSLSETTGAEVAAPPATLYAKDGKQGYNVTTPARAFAYWNTMQHRRSGAEVLSIAEELCAAAIARAEQRTGHKIKLVRWADIASVAMPSPNLDPALDLPEQSRIAMAAAAPKLTSILLILLLHLRLSIHITRRWHFTRRWCRIGSGSVDKGVMRRPGWTDPECVR